MNEHIELGDRVIVLEHGRDFGKMCTVIEASDTNDQLPVRVRVCNSHDPFDFGKYGPDVTERWIPRGDLKKAKNNC